MIENINPQVGDDSVFSEAEHDFFMKPDNIYLCASKPVGYSLIYHYMCVILDLHHKQIDNGCNNITKDQLQSNSVQKLLANLKI